MQTSSFNRTLRTGRGNASLMSLLLLGCVSVLLLGFLLLILHGVTASARLTALRD